MSPEFSPSAPMSESDIYPNVVLLIRATQWLLPGRPKHVQNVLRAASRLRTTPPASARVRPCPTSAVSAPTAKSATTSPPKATKASPCKRPNPRRSWRRRPEPGCSAENVLNVLGPARQQPLRSPDEQHDVR